MAIEYTLKSCAFPGLLILIPASTEPDLKTQEEAFAFRLHNWDWLEGRFPLFCSIYSTYLFSTHRVLDDLMTLLSKCSADIFMP